MRYFYDDIGSGNIRQIMDHPASWFFAPSLIYAEAVSAAISARFENPPLVSEELVLKLLSEITRKLTSSNFTVVQVESRHIGESMQLLRRHKLSNPACRRMGGADAIYLAMALSIARDLASLKSKLTFVTGDNALYEAARNEPGLEVFHLWWCACSECGTEFIAHKGIRQLCPGCGKVCELCLQRNCTNAYQVKFGQ